LSFFVFTFTYINSVFLCCYFYSALCFLLRWSLLLLSYDAFTSFCVIAINIVQYILHFSAVTLPQSRPRRDYHSFQCFFFFPVLLLFLRPVLVSQEETQAQQVVCVRLHGLVVVLTPAPRYCDVSTTRMA
jgi:hypothetical protein